MNSKKTSPQLARDFETLKHEAAVMFIKQAMPVKAICKELKISTAKLCEWIKLDHWNDLRQHPNSKVNLKMNALRNEAAVLYIKNGLSAEAISQQLDVSLPTLAKWNKEGRWSELRPDVPTIKQHKAAVMYVAEGMTSGAIAQAISVSEITVKMWIDLYGWNIARLVYNAPNGAEAILTGFCKQLIQLLPKETGAIVIAQHNYLKNLKFNPDK